MAQLADEQMDDGAAASIERNRPTKQELESKLPIRETRGGAFSPFSSMLEIASSSVPLTEPLGHLSTEGAPLAKSHHGSPVFDWEQTDSIYSVIRHEVVHFFQSILSPIILDNTIQKRVVLAIFLDCLRNHCSSKGIIEFPVELDVKPQFLATNALYLSEPLAQIHTTHILESLAIYHQFMRPDVSTSDWFIREAIYAFNEQGIKDGLYSKLYKSFVFDFRGDAFELFPFVAWTSLLSLKDPTTGKISTPAVYFVSLNEMLFSNTTIKGRLLDRLRSEADVAEVWRWWISVVEEERGVVLEPLDMTVGRIMEQAETAVRQIKRFTKTEYYLPHLVHIRHMADFGCSIVPTLINLFADDSYASVLNQIGWPTFLFDHGPSCVCGPTAEDSHLVSWQLSWHLMEKFLDRIAGQPVVNLCPQTSCPFHAVALCAGHRPYPSNYKDCTFPLNVHKCLGLEVDLCHFDPSKPHGKLHIDLTSFEQMFSTTP